MARRIRVVVHAGFHKTGTTSAQRFLADNGPVLWPHMALGLRPRLKQALFGSRAYSTWGDGFSLEKFSTRFAEYLRGLQLGQKRHLLIASEELSGHLPGRGDLADYAAAPELAAAMEAALHEVLGEGLDLTFLYSLRDPEPWLQSAHWEHVKSSRMGLDFDAFRARYASAADLATAAEAVRARLTAPVETVRLEDLSAARFGPATPLLDLMEVPEAMRAKLTPPAHLNQRRQDPALIAHLLELNRSEASDADVKAEKSALLSAP